MGDRGSSSEVARDRGSSSEVAHSSGGAFAWPHQRACSRAMPAAAARCVSSTEQPSSRVKPSAGMHSSRSRQKVGLRRALSYRQR